MKSKSFKFITLPLLALMLLSIAFSAYKKYGGEQDWDWNVGKLFDFSSSIFSADTIYFTPNTRENQKVFDLEEPGTYEIKVSGSYKKCFLRDGKEELWRMPPNGMTRTNWPSAEYCRHLPLPNRRPFMVIAIIDGKVISVGYDRKIKVNKPTAIYLNINVPQNWAEIPGKNPEDNFKHNRGRLRVEIEKDWAIFEKIAEIFNSLGQYFKG